MEILLSMLITLIANVAITILIVQKLTTKIVNDIDKQYAEFLEELKIIILDKF